MYLPVADEALADFLTDNAGHRREGSLSPGAMPLATERALKDKAKERLPDYYLELSSGAATPPPMRSTTARCPPIARHGFVWSEMREHMRDHIPGWARLRE